MKALQSKYINVNGFLLDLSSPCVMGILNVTPDSFYAGSRMQTEIDITHRIEQMSALTLRVPMRRMCRLRKRWNVCVWGWVF